MEPEAGAQNKVLLIGWDAADWKIILPMVEEGKLPFIEQLINRGTMGNLATLQPVLSPLLWNAMATGKHADKHGILSFVEPRPDGAGVRPVSSTSRRCKALWEMLADEGMRSSIVSWWASHPAEETNGVIVSNLVQQAGVSKNFESWRLPPGTVTPESERNLIADLRLHPSEITAQQVAAIVPRASEVDQEKDRRLNTIAKLLADFATTHAIGTHLAERGDWDLLAVYYDSIDHFGHAFMKYRPPRAPKISEEDCAIYGEVVENCYRMHDLALGRYLELVDENTTVMIVSDHGFHSDDLRPLAGTIVQGEGQAHQHRDYGIILVAGPDIKEDERIYGATLLDVGPTILHALGLPVARDMDGRVLTKIFEDERDPEWIDSWETRGEPRVVSQEEMDPWAAKAAMEQLAELGYIEEDDENSQRILTKTIAQRCMNLGTIYMSRNEYGKAAKAFEEMAKYQAFPTGLTRLASCYFKIGEHDKSRALTAKLLEDCPDHPLANITKGELLLLDGKEEEAFECFRSIEFKGLALPRLQINLGMIYLRRKCYEDAERVFRKAIDEDNDNALAYYGLGEALIFQQRFEEAVEVLMTSVSLLHHQPRAHYRLAVALAALGHLQWATQAAEIALTLNSNTKAPHLLLHKIYKQLGDVEKAARHKLNADDIDKAHQKKTYAEEFMMDDTDLGVALNLDSPAKAKGETADINDEGSTSASSRPAGECVVLVSGLPRSGTSMMMQMLEAGGFPLLADAKRPADESNPKGYFEFEPVKRIHSDTSWLNDAEGKAVKVVAPLLRALPQDRFYKVILMNRPLEEVLASQTSMLKRLRKSGRPDEEQPTVSPARMRAAFEAQLAFGKRDLESSSCFDVFAVDYHQAIANPAQVAQQVADFLGADLGLDREAMARAVDQTMHREHTSPSS